MTKLIEVALPVEAISRAARRDKDRKTGTIKNVHKWFAPMPTPAWRALLFAALVDDPGDEAARKDLLALVERLVPEDGGPPNPDDLEEAKELIREAMGNDLPTVLDPFCGGGSTLVEAQRLGLPTVGSDLNPVPVLITRVLTELVPMVAGRPPLVGEPGQLGRMTGGPLDGLVADVRHYAQRVRDEVWAEVGHLYPAPPGEGTLVAWFWARTVTCPNPACRAIAPLVSSFWLSKRKNAKQWVVPVPQGPGRPVRFEVAGGEEGPSTVSTMVGRSGARCVNCGEPIPLPWVRVEGRAGRLGCQLLAATVDSDQGRTYLGPTATLLRGADAARPDDAPELDLVGKATINVGLYGIRTQADLYTNRQLVMLGHFADTVAKTADWVRADGGAEIYAGAISSVLGLGLGKLSAAHSSQARLEPPATGGSHGGIHPAFARHALPMMWDFAELNPFASRGSNWLGVVDSTLAGLTMAQRGTGRAVQSDARDAGSLVRGALVATDPPYFGQIDYADLSDYFYVWHRRALSRIHPDLYGTVATPKVSELIAAPHRHGGSRTAAEHYFIDGFAETFLSLKSAQHPTLPMMIVYAHRQEDSDRDGDGASTAWSAMLAALLRSGLQIVGTWPIHATTSNRQIGQGANALASYVVLVCRPAIANARMVDRNAYLAALRAELPTAIRHLEEGAISAIDLGQATYGPGMAVFSRFRQVIEPDGQPMTVSAALGLISKVQAEVLEEFVSDLDNATRWAMAWFKDYGFEPGPFGEAEKVFTTTNTSYEALQRVGIVRGPPGFVTLVPREELPDTWDPDTDLHRSVWEVTQHMVKRLDHGVGAVAEILRKVPAEAESARELAYWLFTACERTRPREAALYDALVTEWPEIVKAAEAAPPAPPGQLPLG